MIDRDEVMRAAEICTNNTVNCEECPYDSPDTMNPIICMADLIADLYELLKVQESIKPDALDPMRVYVCGNCHYRVLRENNYCPNCGRKVKWDD